MAKSILDGKKFLAVDDGPDILDVLEGVILDACSHCVVDKATTYDAAVKYLETPDYDIVILDIMGVQGFDLLEIAVKKKLKVVVLTAHALNPEAFQRSYAMKARAYLPKDKLGEINSYLEDVLTCDFEPGWKRLYKNLRSFFDDVFGSYWEKKTGIKETGWGEY
jgi:DNA-binding NarL/FixJ family response regulator